MALTLNNRLYVENFHTHEDEYEKEVEVLYIEKLLQDFLKVYDGSTDSHNGLITHINTVGRGRGIIINSIEIKFLGNSNRVFYRMTVNNFNREGVVCSIKR